MNGNATIGTVTIGTTGAGNFKESDVIAGIQTGFGTNDDNQFGTDDDSQIFISESQSFSKIGSVVINGQALNGKSFHGIEASQIDLVRINGETLKLTKLVDLIDYNSSLRIRELITQAV